jgi:hypothetical protein
MPKDPGIKRRIVETKTMDIGKDPVPALTWTGMNPWAQVLHPGSASKVFTPLTYAILLTGVVVSKLLLQVLGGTQITRPKVINVVCENPT